MSRPANKNHVIGARAVELTGRALSRRLPLNILNPVSTFGGAVPFGGQTTRDLCGFVP